MKKNQKRAHGASGRRVDDRGSVRLGKVLLELRNAIRRAQRCRLTLYSLGFSQRRWQEIVKDVDPDLRFMVRPQLIDAIINRLESAGEPVNREALVLDMAEQGEGPMDRIRSAITTNLRARKLVLHAENKIGLPPRWNRRPA